MVKSSRFEFIINSYLLNLLKRRLGIFNTPTSFHIGTNGCKRIFLLSQAEVPVLFSSSFTASKTLVTTTSKTHVGTVVGVVVAIVVALAIIMAVIYLVKKKNRRVTSHSDPTTSAPCTVAVTQVARNDNVTLTRLQFPPQPVSTVPSGSFFSMNVECGAYPPHNRGMKGAESPPPYATS